MEFIDIHNHCAWAIDDGAQNIDECRKILRLAEADGVKTIIATPHFIPGQIDLNHKSIVKSRLDDLNVLAEDFGINIIYGSEILLNRDFLEMINNNNFLTLGESKYILVEFDILSDLGDENEVEERLYEIILLGYIPIIAHVERYFKINSLDLNRIMKWIEMGCYIQVNRSSLIGLHGKKARKNAIILIKKGLVHVIASDAHSMESGRYCILSDAFQIVKKITNLNSVEILFFRNPMHIIKNEKLEKIKKTSLFRR